jgi:flagellar hook assembly protein FlgD
VLHLRQLLFGAACVALLAAAAASAATRTQRRAAQQSVSTSELMPGVTYRREVDFTSRGPVVLDIVTAPKPDGTVYTLAPVLSNDVIRGTEKLTAIEGRLDAGATSVGIDGDYFDPKTGAPHGILMQGGALENEPAPGRSSIGIDASGLLDVARVSFTGTWQGSGQRRSLRLNVPGSKPSFTLYTAAYGAKTPRESNVVEAVLSSLPPIVPGQPLAGTVTQVTSAGPTKIPSGGAVLVGRRSQAAQLEAEASVGQQVEVRLTLSSSASGFASAIGGGPLLVRDGKPVFHAGEAFEGGSLTRRSARGAVGQLPDGRILLVSVEGTNPAYSIGMSSYELAVELARLGAQTAVGLGSGRAAGMAFDGTLLTRPSGGGEARLSDALLLSYTGVYAAPPSASVLSPNGDGVDDTQTFTYRLVRPSTVAAGLTGPGGTNVSLANDSESPGLHQLTWDGTVAGTPAPEGAWTFTVTATDDRGVTTTAQRPFSLDDTLGSLVLSSGPGRRPVVTFNLTRPARVVVQVERRNGVAVAKLFSGQLAPGHERLVWNGRIRGQPAPAGRYQVDVRATSVVGRSSLFATFSFRAHLGH